LTAITGNEAGLKCPHCHAFAGLFVQEVLRKHTTCKSSERKKKAFKILKKKVQLWLLISPEWVKGVAGSDANGQEYGGYAGADVEITKSWNEKRLENLSLIEVRAKKEPDVFFYKGEKYSTTGTMPANGQFSCNHCGKEQKLVNAKIRNIQPLLRCMLCSAIVRNAKKITITTTGDILRLLMKRIYGRKT
jgi:hypothetical protein